MEPLHNLSFLIMEFRLSQSLSQTFFTRWDFGYHRAFHELFFHTMEVWLSWSLSRTFLSHDWIFGYHGAFRKLFFHTIGFWLSQSLSRTFLMVELTRHMIWGNTLFIYITKSIYIGSALLKTLPLNLEPLCKEKSTVLLILK
jgi:hypothetical protein